MSSDDFARLNLLHKVAEEKFSLLRELLYDLDQSRKWRKNPVWSVDRYTPSLSEHFSFKHLGSDFLGVLQRYLRHRIRSVIAKILALPSTSEEYF